MGIQSFEKALAVSLEVQGYEPAEVSDMTKEITDLARAAFAPSPKARASKNAYMRRYMGDRRKTKGLTGS